MERLSFEPGSTAAHHAPSAGLGTGLTESLTKCGDVMYTPSVKEFFPIFSPVKTG